MSIRSRHLTCFIAAVAAALLCAPASAQSPRQRLLGFAETGDASLAVEYSSATSADREHDRVWFYGGAAEASATLWRGLGASASLLGLDAPDIGNGVGVHLISFAAGPSYRSKEFWEGTRHAATLSAHAQFGIAAGFAGLYPGAGSPSSNDNAFAARLGGAIDLRVAPRLSIRLFQADWLRTDLSNGGANRQNTLQLGAGIVLHAKRSR